MTTFWCGPCESWSQDAACWICGQVGVDTADDWRTVTARAWTNPATWTAEDEDAS